MIVEKTCLVCGEKFSVPNWRKSAKYCSVKCQRMSLRAENNLVCPCCGKEFHRKNSHIKRYIGSYGFYCSKECLKIGRKMMMSGENNHQYGLKGSLNSSFKGYDIADRNNNNVDIKVYEPTHPYCDKNGRVAKHRLVVEQNHELFDDCFFDVIDGRYCLKKEFCVHHIDLNHDNNSVDNLQVLTRSQHAAVHNKDKQIVRDKKTGRIIGVLKK